MGKILTIASKEIKTAFKDKAFLAVALLFLLLSILSVYIGSATKNAEITAYQNIINLLKSQGAASVPAEPKIFPLALLKNIINYVAVIGSIVAIFLGFDSFSEEREQGTIKLLLSRPIYRDQLINGKFLGGAVVIAGLLIITLVFNWFLFTVFSGINANFAEFIRLTVFFIFAFYYMMSFYLASLFVSIKSQNSTFAFLLMLIIWMGVSYVIPQLAESQKNYVYVLNNISQTMNQMPQDTLISKTIEIFSPTAQFKNIGRELLQVVPEHAQLPLFTILKMKLQSIIYLIVPGLFMLFGAYNSFLKEGN